jgi:hypothetical protein
VRLKQASHHTPPKLRHENPARSTSSAPSSSALDPAVKPFLDALAELGARAVLRDLDPRNKYQVRIKPKSAPKLDKPKFKLVRPRQ